MRRNSEIEMPVSVREILDLGAQVANAGGFGLGEILPSLGRQVGDRLHPVRIKLGAGILRQEVVALDTIAFGQAQQAALVGDQALVDVVELLDQAVDAVLVERQRLDRGDQRVFQFLVAALLGRRQRAGGGEAGFHLLVLQLAELLVGVGDGVERFHHLRAKLGFHGGEREIVLVVVVLVLFILAFAADIGDVVGRGLFGAGLFLLLGNLAVGLDLLRALELRRSLGLGTGIGGFQIDDLAQERRALVELLAPDDDRLEGQRAFAQARDHGLAAGLDALGDGDFALARQKLHGAHFAKIHPDRIVGAVGRLLSSLQPRRPCRPQQRLRRPRSRNRSRNRRRLPCPRRPRLPRPH
jgi:hypothetical protein